MKSMSAVLCRILFIVFGLWIIAVCVSSVRWLVILEKPYWLIVAEVAACLFLAFAWNWGSRKKKILDILKLKWLRVAVWALFAGSFALRIWIAVDMQLIPTYDLEFSYNSALYLAENGYLPYSDWLGYVSNNIPLIMFWSICFKVTGWLGVENYYLVGGILNACMIQLAIFFAYKSVRIFVDAGKAALVLLMCMLNPVLYVYVPYYYTDTVCLVFFMGFVYAFFKGMTFDGKKKYAYWALAGAALAIGFTIRVTVLIAGIAAVIYLIIRLKRTDWKSHVSGLAVMVLLVLCVRIGYEAMYNKQIPEGVAENSLSVMHFIRMGTHGEGGYCSEDFHYTISLPNTQERFKVNFLLVKDSLKEQGIKGFFELQREKILSAWVIGDKGYEQYMQKPAGDSVLYPWLVGEHAGFFLEYCQFYNSFLFVSLLLCLFHRWKAPEWNLYSYCVLTILGAVVFYMFWEVQVRHTLCFYLVLAILAAYSWNENLQLEE